MLNPTCEECISALFFVLHSSSASLKNGNEKHSAYLSFKNHDAWCSSYPFNEICDYKV